MLSEISQSSVFIIPFPFICHFCIILLVILEIIFQGPSKDFVEHVFDLSPF